MIEAAFRTTVPYKEMTATNSDGEKTYAVAVNYLGRHVDKRRVVRGM